MKKTWLKILLVPLVLLLMRFLAGAKEGSVLKLSELIQEVLENNPRIEAAKAEWEAQKARIGQVNLLDDPELGVDTWNIPSDLNLSETRNWIFFVRQRFPFPGTLSLREGASRAEALEVSERLKATVREIISEVKITYADLYLAHKAIEVTQENVEILRRFEQIALVKYATGEVSQQDVLKAQVELARLANDLVTLEQELSTVRALLNTLRDYPPRSQVGMPEGLVLMKLPQGLDALEKLALEERPEVRATQAAIARSEHEIALAKKRYYPDFQVAVKRFQNHGISQANGWGLSATINIPWLFHKKHDQRLIETRYRLAQREALRKTLENDTRFAVADLFAKTETAERLATLYQTSVLPQAEQAVKSADIGYRADRVDFLDLLESQRRLEEFRLEYYRAVVMQNRGVARMEQVLGIDLSDIENEEKGGLP